MRIGYLHLGPLDHGVPRLGRILAAEAHKRSALSVIETATTLTGHWRADRARIIAAARELNNADIVHLQYNSQRDKSVWGRGWRQLYHLRLFARVCRRPFVIQVSDFYPRQPPIALLRQAPLLIKWFRTKLRKGLSSASSAKRAPIRPLAFAKEVRNTFGSVGSTVRWLARHSRLMLVCSEEEQRRLYEFVTAGRIRLISLFVEERTLSLGVADSKAALGLSGCTVLTLLGYVHPRKGHRLLLEALAQLPAHYFVVFAGQAREERTKRDVLGLARSCGVESRVRLTGYLPEEELNRYLAATDLAVCPFETVAASSSINTWISAARPILASDLPLIAEYNRLAPGAIRTFSPYTADALSHAIRDMIETGDDSLSGVFRLRDRLAISKIFDEHLDAYRQALSGRKSTEDETLLPIDIAADVKSVRR